MKIYNKLAADRMDSTSALLASLPQTFTLKEFNSLREQMTRENSKMANSSLRFIPRAYMPYSMEGLREIGAIVIAFSEPIEIGVLIPIYKVFARSTGEVLFSGTYEECENFIGEDWRNLGMGLKCREERKIMVKRNHYSVDYEAYRTYIRETFGAL